MSLTSLTRPVTADEDNSTDDAVAAVVSNVADAVDEINKADKAKYEAGKAILANDAHKANENVDKTNEAVKAS